MSKKSLAKKGRHGDTLLRDVFGLTSHVNKREAELIDNKGLLGELITKLLGSGTINPKTGLSEYHLGDHSDLSDLDWQWHKAQYFKGHVENKV